ncbi:MAG: glycosyltransferase N-terminal domain-containing protein [Synergistaceae bacterium]|nr:glycosyltransferase N-terminal domain-containing protein [Synergistaceae bacterium]
MGSPLYSLVVSAAYMAAFPWLARRYADGLDERRGYYRGEKKKNFPDHPLWVHAVSVGEVQTATPLLSALAGVGHPPKDVLLSTTTPTGRKMADRVAGGLYGEHIYYPWDVPWIVERALNILRPRAFVVLETEVWPNMLFSLARRKIPAFMVNARFSDRTAANIHRFSSFWRDVYDQFTLLLVRSESDREVMLRLGIEEKKISVMGDCKVDALLLRRKGTDLTRARELAGGKHPHFLAGSTHEGEDEIVLDAFRRVRLSFPSARLIIVPRHPERAEKVRKLAAPFGRTALLSAEESEWDILVVDRIGVLFDLYGAADSAFIGGSLVDRGGQNIMEPAAFGIPLSHGPYMRDFTKSARELADRGAAFQVKNSEELADFWRRSLNPGVRQKAAAGAEAYFEAFGGAAAASLTAMAPFIPGLEAVQTPGGKERGKEK